MGVKIGSAWKPGHIVRRNTETGVFEEVNSPLYSDTEVKVQQALLKFPGTQRGDSKWAARKDSA